MASSYDPPSQRRHLRVEAPAKVIIDDTTYDTSDWSVGGFSIEGYEGDAGEGDSLQVEFQLNFQGFHISFENEATVVRVDEEAGELGAKYSEELDDRKRNLLEYFVTGWLEGEMGDVEDTLARIDIPVSSEDQAAEPSDEEDEIPFYRDRRRIMITSIYLLLGVVILGYIFISLYQNFTRITVSTAVVTKDLQKIRVEEDGTLQDLYVEVGNQVEEGEKLFRIRSRSVQQRLREARYALQEAKKRRSSAKEELKQARRKLESYRTLTERRLDSLNEQLGVRRKEYEAKKKNLSNRKTLYQDGAISIDTYQNALETFGEASSAYQDIRERVDRNELNQKALKQGYFFSNNKLNDLLSTRKQAFTTAENKVELAKEKLKQVRELNASLTHKAPFDGQVVRQKPLKGALMKSGDTVFVLEKKDTKPRVEAFLTQEEIKYIGMGSTASIYIPSLDWESTARVVDIHRGFRLVDMESSRYEWVKDEGRTARVVLEFTTVPEGRTVSGGAPVLINFPTFQQGFLN